MGLSRLRLHVDAQSVVLLLVGEASPILRILGENHRPLVLPRNHVQSIGSLVERLAFNGDRIAERDRRILIRARAPYLSIGNKLAPDLAVVGPRPVIVHGDVGDADALHHLGMLALPGQIEHQRFASGGLSMTKTRYQQNTGEQNKQTNFVHGEAPFSAADRAANSNTT